MNRMLLIILSLTSLPVLAHYSEKEIEKEQQEMIEQRMEEEAPTSTSLGGSRGGSLEVEKNRDEQKMQEEHDFEKQRQLYEYDGHYRRGL